MSHMITLQNRQSRIRRVAAKLSALVAGCLFAGAAFAHVFPQKQEPGAGATVESPAQVRVMFDGPLEASFSSLKVTDASGKEVNTEKSAVDAHQAALIAVPLPQLAAGRYTVHWVAVASDGHRTHGDYSFNVK